MPWISSTELWRLKRGNIEYKLVSDALESVQQSLTNINQRLHTMSAEIDRLTASVTKLTTVDASLVELTGKLAQAIRDNATDPAALNALADKLDAEAQTVSDAVVANTPAQT